MFAIKRVLNRIQILSCRTCTTQSKLVEVTQDDTGIAIISMRNPPVNSLNKKLLDALNMSLIDTQKQKYQGIILTSSRLDIMEMYNKTEKELTEYWNTLQNTWLTLYGLEIPIAAAINGASPAGGCLLALSCEYRVLVQGNYTMGLNETQLGITAPEWFRNLYIETIGYRRAEIALLQGTLFHPKEALEIGLVDELTSDKSNAIKKCQDYIKSFKNISTKGRQRTKMELRKHNLLWLKVNRSADLNEFLTFVQLPDVQAGLKLYIQTLKKK
ncbi:Enoyl-CoA delta isomerase 1, mitochondrial [Eufriesea mexicana]|uniref:Enoyl-CoA delta isomerase 1, mitochondrial n=1 Tax=Eufriesea mexicana TaxID=516756 RepID=A0A310S7B3_9HYME|nr:Enoyl-CoA delta isomerase 1, mitochondrial [Eufriesea mexicana]